MKIPWATLGQRAMSLVSSSLSCCRVHSGLSRVRECRGDLEIIVENWLSAMGATSSP